jgi:hypothetical protein
LLFSLIRHAVDLRLDKLFSPTLALLTFAHFVRHRT